MKKYRASSRKSTGKKRQKISSEVKNEIKRMLDSGATMAEIARQLNISPSVVKDKVSKDPDLIKQPRRRMELDDDQIDFVYKSLLENIALEKIADELGMSRFTLTNRCREIPKLEAFMLKKDEKRVRKLSNSEREKIKEMAPHMDAQELARYLRRDPKKFAQLIKDDEEINTFIEESKILGFRKSSRALLREVDDGNIAAIKYFENTRFKKMETKQVKQEVKTDFSDLNIAMFNELMKLTEQEQEDEIRRLSKELDS